MCKIINKVKKLFCKCSNKTKNNKGDISVTTVIVWVAAITVAIGIAAVITHYGHTFADLLTKKLDEGTKQ